MANIKSDDRIVWGDVETTGLKDHEHALLEIAVVVTDTQLNILDEEGFHAVVYYPATVAEELRSISDEYVQRMHDDTGLWAKLPRGKLLSVIDAELAEYIQRFAPNPRQAYLAGNSIRLDRNFIETYLPQVDAHMHYRMVDVTTPALLAQWWIDPELVYQKQYTHSARKDIRESIEELRFHRDRWMTPPF